MKRVYDKELVIKYLNEIGLEDVFSIETVEKLHLRMFDEKEVVRRVGEEVKSMSIVLAGTLLVVPASEEGKDAIIHHLNVGEVLGDIEYLHGGCNIQTVVSQGNAVVLEIPGEVIEKELMDSAPFLRFLATNLADKLHKSSKIHSGHLVSSTKKQLVEYILERVQSDDEMGEDIVAIKNIEVARVLGSSDRHIRRLFKELLEDGFIEKVKRGYIKIIDIEGLRKL